MKRYYHYVAVFDWAAMVIFIFYYNHADQCIDSTSMNMDV
jgi:hypothetical protein